MYTYRTWQRWVQNNNIVKERKKAEENNLQYYNPKCGILMILNT